MLWSSAALWVVTAIVFPAGLSRPRPVPGVLGSHVYRPRYSTQPTGLSGVSILPGRGVQLELEEMLVPRKMSISPLESWLTTRYLLPRLDAGAPGTVASAQFYKCPPSQLGEGAEQGDEGVQDVPQIQCKNVLKIRRRKMNHHKYRKLVKRTRFLRRKVREGRLKRKQVRVGPGPSEWGKAAESAWLSHRSVSRPSLCPCRSSSRGT